MSASAFTATVDGWPGAAGIVDQTVEPRFTTGFCGLSGEAISSAARAELGSVSALWPSPAGDAGWAASPAAGAASGAPWGAAA